MADLRYYPLLDSVLFDGAAADELPHRVVSATASLLLDLLVHRTVVVLSQSQVIDSSYVLDLVRDDASRGAFLSLVRDNRVQTRFMARGLARPAAGGRFTVLNVFASNLQRGFHFSAWPELADPAARDHVAAYLSGATAERPGAELADRLDALIELDRAFRDSSATERAGKLPARERLRPRVVADFKSHPSDTPTRQMWRAVRRLVDAAGTDAQGQPVYNLDSRSDWRKLLPVAAQQLGVGDDVVAAMSTVIDLHYNCVVGTSLGAATCVDETAEPRVPIGLRTSAIPVEFDPRVTVLLDPAAGNTGLTWADAHARLASNELPLRPDARLEVLLQDRMIEMVDGKRLVKILARTPRKVVQAAQIGIPGGVTGFEIGGHLGLVGAVLGGVTGEAFTPGFLVGAKAVGRWETMIRDRAIGRQRRSLGITTRAGHHG